jgi:hypothetical protein
MGKDRDGGSRSMIEHLLEMVRNLVAARETLAFIRDPKLSALMQAAFDEALRDGRERARALDCEDEFEEALGRKPQMN